MNIRINIDDQGKITQQDASAEIASTSIHNDGGISKATSNSNVASVVTDASTAMDIGAPPAWLYEAIGGNKQAEVVIDAANSDAGSAPIFS